MAGPTVFRVQHAALSRCRLKLTVEAGRGSGIPRWLSHLLYTHRLLAVAIHPLKTQPHRWQLLYRRHGTGDTPALAQAFRAQGVPVQVGRSPRT